jgi:hypothetical protein
MFTLLPRVGDTLDELKDADFLIQLDIASKFWQARRVREEDVQKTAFQTPNGLMEWMTMPFGFCIGPATFQRMIRDFLHEFIAVYLDDTCIYSCSRWRGAMYREYWDNPARVRCNLQSSIAEYYHDKYSVLFSARMCHGKYLP